MFQTAYSLLLATLCLSLLAPLSHSQTSGSVSPELEKVRAALEKYHGLITHV